jgi:hypothetical protein
MTFCSWNPSLGICEQLFGFREVGGQPVRCASVTKASVNTPYATSALNRDRHGLARTAQEPRYARINQRSAHQEKSVTANAPGAGIELQKGHRVGR